MFDEFLTLKGLLSFLTLTVMEIVLGIDNVIFISILSNRIDLAYQKRVRLLGLSLALIVRLGLLGLLSQISHIEKSLFVLFGLDFEVKHVIFILGGLFLLYKSIKEIYEAVSGEEVHSDESPKKKLSAGSAIVQIILLDVVFSFDSILTAIGLSGNMLIMSVAVVIAVVIMLVASKVISSFIHDNPTVKILALSFLMTIGVMLVAKGFHQEIPPGYIYFSLAFSLLVEILNLRAKKNAQKKIARQ